MHAPLDAAWTGLLAQLHDAATVTDAAGRILFWNQAAHDLYGVAPDVALGRDVAELAPLPTTRTGGAWRGPATHRHRDGTPLAVDVTTQPLHAPGERERLTLTLIRPSPMPHPAAQVAAAPGLAHTWHRSSLPARARADGLGAPGAELAQALTLKGEFLAMISHELRTPLNAVLGYTDMLAEEIYGALTPRQHDALQKIAHAGRHLVGVITTILDMACLEAGAVTLELGPVDVESIVAAALQSVQQRAEQKQIRLTRTVVAGTAGVQADARRLTQILTSLLDNAVKFTPAGGSAGLDVAAAAEHEQITFTVWDTGIGIAARDMGRLFRPFTQVDGRLAREYTGIGLGLTLVRRLAELHGGSVAVVSTPGQGSRFTVTLPWAQADTIRPHQGGAVPDPPRWAHAPWVLIAVHDETSLGRFAEMLTAHGCTVVAARNGFEALDQIRAQPVDVVLLDIQMPGVDGLTVLQRMRAEPPTAARPIITVTTLAVPGDRERYLEAGANRYLAKPVSARTLLATITDVLTESRALRAGAGASEAS